MKRPMITTIGAGLSVAALALAGWGAAASSADPEFIELPYLETSSIISTTLEPLAECDAPEPGVLVCDLEVEAALVSTLIGHSTEILRGEIRLGVGQSCTLSTGVTGIPFTTQFPDSTMFTADGSEIYFRASSEGCTAGAPPDAVLEQIGFWEIDGGTSRFEGASGLLSTVTSEGTTHSSGTIRVRTDRWDAILPAAAPVVITAGSASVDEGDSGEVVVEVPVTLSVAAGETVTVDWTTIDPGGAGVATADVDYVAASGTVTFDAEETEQTIPITVNGDTEVEPVELFGGQVGLLQLSNPSANAEIDTGGFYGLGLFVIVDDD